MWDQQKNQRFQELQARQVQLSDAERAERTALVQELEAAETTYLSAATDRLRQERETTEKQNRDLEELTNRRKALMQRLNIVLAEAGAERRTIENELASVIAGSGTSHLDE